MIAVQGVSMRYGSKVLFDEVTATFTPGRRYGLTGPNGAGKSTFMKLLTGELDPQKGSVVRPKKVGVLRQDQFAFDQFRVVDTVVMGNARLWRALAERDALYEKPELTDEDGMRLGELEGIIGEEEGYTAESDAAILLDGLDIPESLHGRAMSELQGGQKVRVLLAQALFGHPQALLLDEPEFLVALAATVYRRYRERAAGISGQLPGHGVSIGSDFVVVVKGEGGLHRHVPVTIAAAGSTVDVTVGERRYAIAKDWQFGGIRATGTCNGRPFTAQAERHGVWYGITHNGLHIDAMVMSARASELLRVMPFKAPPDMSKFLLSPMPGLLVDVVVKPGQAVQAGERLAVIEAMKMENILIAQADGVVGELLATKGESLAVDQPIMSFA